MSWGPKVVQEEVRPGQVVGQVVGLVVQQQPELPSTALVKPGLLRRPNPLRWWHNTGGLPQGWKKHQK